ncbi:hypothetical protein MRX96_009357 [Rhipicephalus microplus]
MEPVRRTLDYEGTEHAKEAEDLRHSHRELNNIKKGLALQQLVTSKMILEKPPNSETSYEEQVRTSENTIEKAGRRDSVVFIIRQVKSRTVQHKILPKLTVVDNSVFHNGLRLENEDGPSSQRPSTAFSAAPCTAPWSKT